MKNFININDVKNYQKLVDDALILKKNKLKFNKTSKAKKHNIPARDIASLIETFPDAIGRFFVLNTLASNSLSNISFTMHPADLIKTEPRKKSKR